MDVGLVFRTPSSSSAYLIIAQTLGTTGTTIVILNQCQNSQKWKSLTESPFGVVTLAPYFSPRPSKVFKPHKHQCENGLGRGVQRPGFPHGFCPLTLGRSVTPVGCVSSSAEREHCTKLSQRPLLAFTFQDFMISKLWSPLSEQFPDQEHMLGSCLVPGRCALY